MTTQLFLLRLSVLGLSLMVASSLATLAQSIVFTSSPYPAGSDGAEAFIGVAYNYDAETESNGGDVRYSLSFGPPGIVVDEWTGVVSWQPSEEGVFDVEIRAELSNDPSVNATQMWKISASTLKTHPGCTGNDAWLPAGRGLPGYVMGTAVADNKLFALHLSESSFERAVCRLSMWNGTYWTTLSKQERPDDTAKWDGHLISFRDEIYRYAKSSVIPGPSKLEAIVRWDGSSWMNVGEHDFTQIHDAVIHDDALYVLGLHLVGPVETQAIAKWDGTTWQVVFEEQGIWGAALAAANGRLYAACQQKAFGLSPNELPLFELRDGNLEPVDNRTFNTSDEYHVHDLNVHNGSLILSVAQDLATPCFQWDGTTVRDMPMPPVFDISGYPLSLSPYSFNNQLYLAGWQIHGIGGPYSARYMIWRLADDRWHPVSKIMVVRDQGPVIGRLKFIDYMGSLYSYGLLNESCGIILNNVAVYQNSGECASISGTVFHDDNRDCIRDQIEPALSGELIEILPGPFYAVTDAAGNFRTMLRPGTYTVNLSPNTHWMSTCPKPQEITLGSAAASAEGVTIATDMIAQIHDVSTSLAVGPLRPGFDATYTLTYWNSGTELASGRVVFEYDSRLAFKASSQMPARHNNNVLEWDFANLPIGMPVSITITLNIPATMQLGTEICAAAKAEHIRKDDEQFLGDNHDVLCERVRGSYDPNDIQVSPQRYGEENEILPLHPGDTILSYLVRFQNTGTDTAFTVIVSDTLDASLLDITSIRLGAASHDYDFDISGSGILTWTFNNILLPDSNVNELASHGYFKYTVHLRKGLAPMTQIPNRASIYFDYNAPVMTNTVVSITSVPLSVGDDEERAASLEIYPNPVQGTSSIRLNLTEREHVSLRLIDGRGDVIAIITDREMNAGEHTLSLNGRELSGGAYYLMFERDGKKEIYPIVVNR